MMSRCSGDISRLKAHEAQPSVTRSEWAAVSKCRARKRREQAAGDPQPHLQELVLTGSRPKSLG